MCFVYLPFLCPLNLSALPPPPFIFSSLSNLKFGTFEMQYYCYMVLEIIINIKILGLLRFLLECAWQRRLGLKTTFFWIIMQRSGNFLLTFQDNLSVPFIFSLFLTLEDGEQYVILKRW
jgi:hypothetical protein